MKKICLSSLTVTVLLAFTMSASAQNSVAAFQLFAGQRATARNQFIEAWYWANLDEDAALEMVAILCPTGTDDRGAYLIEKNGQRWEIGFDYNGRTGRCGTVPGPLPVWQRQALRYIEHDQSHHGGSHTTRVALRRGWPVLIWASWVNDVRSGDYGQTLDFDKMVRAGRIREWPSIATCDAAGWCGASFTLSLVR